MPRTLLRVSFVLALLALLACSSDEGAGTMESTGNTRLLVGKAFAKDGILTPKAGSPLTFAPRNFGAGGCTLTLGASTLVPADAAVTTTDRSAKVKAEPLPFTKNAYLP